MKTKRNEGRHTDAAQVERNILAAMLAHGCDWQSPANMSSLGFWGFPGYSFKAPQGAAFAASRIVRGMVIRKLLGRVRHGYAMTEAGKLAALGAQRATRPLP